MPGVLLDRGLQPRYDTTEGVASVDSKQQKPGSKKFAQRTKHAASPTLPLLPAHGHKPIEQLFPQLHRRNLVRLTLPIHNLQPIRHRLARRPAHHNLRLPPQSAHLLQLPDIRHGHRELGRCILGLEARAVRGFGGEGDRGDVDVGGDVDPAFAALVAALEVDGAGDLRVVGLGQDAEVVLGVPGAGDGACLVDAEFGLDARLGGAFEEAENVLAVSVFLLLGLVALSLLFGGLFVRVFVYGLVDLFVRSVDGQVISVYGGWFGRWGLV